MSNFIKTLFIISLSLVCLYGCGDSGTGNWEGKDKFVVTKDGEGNLQSEINYTNDSIEHGLSKYYYYPGPKNMLKDEIEFSYGKKEGWHKHYRKDGTLESKIHWKNNLQDGGTFWYYENGKLTSEGFWVKGKSHGLTKWYYRNGQLELLNMTNFSGETFYVLRYDEQGNKTKEEGKVFSSSFIAVYSGDSTETPITEPSVKTNKEVAIKITVAQLPQTKTIIRMGEISGGSMIELPIENYTATYKTTFTEKGEHQLVTIGEIKDLHGNVIKRDSIATAIVVED